ncbi:MAG: YggT family protein [Acidimicrobiia bacterium]
MTTIIVWILNVFLVVLVLRAILSWFPIRPGTFFAGLNSMVFDLTEPVLRPVRRVVPPAGMLDTSFMIVFFAVVILRSVFASA